MKTATCPARAGLLRFGVLIVLVASVAGCRSRAPQAPRIEAMDRPADAAVLMEVTAYSHDRKSTNWKRNWLGKPVIASGPNRGQPKVIGLTASGVKARKGSVAADPRWPFGTIVFVPGYGWGRVEDRGGAIRGTKLDLYFSSRGEALKWGRQQVEVLVWFP